MKFRQRAQCHVIAEKKGLNNAIVNRATCYVSMGFFLSSQRNVVVVVVFFPLRHFFIIYSFVFRLMSRRIIIQISKASIGCGIDIWCVGKNQNGLTYKNSIEYKITA